MSAGGGGRKTPDELLRELKARAAELHRRLPEMRRAARERVRQHPAVRQARARRRVRRGAAVAVFALIALFLRCECQPAPPVPAKEEARAPAPPASPAPRPPPAPAKPKPLHAEGQRLSRARFTSELREAPPWMDEYRLQVAARSPRLARCFQGAGRPGALRWIASVNPKSGEVSDHQLQPVGAGGEELRQEQRECLLEALSSPPYRLTAPGTPALPDRVGLVIEF